MYIVFSLFLQTIKLSVMATVAAIIIWLIKLLLKNKLSPAWHYYIWFIIIIRLLLPYSLSSPFSIYNTVNIDKNITSNIINTSNTQITNNPAYIYTKINVNNSFNQDSNQNILHILSIIWIAVLAIGAIYLLCIYTIFCFKVKSEESFREVEICDTLKQCKKAMKVRCNIQIKKSNSVKTPCIIGLIKPVILIPKYMTHKLTNEEVKYIIIHELTHFRRKDTFVNWLITLLNLIHWFNPILYFSFKRLRQDSEIACDAKALSYIKSNNHKKYGDTIINLTSLVSSFDVKPWEVPMVSKSEIKRRIIMITKFKKRTLIGTLVGVVAACIIGGSILTNAKILNTSNNKAAQSKVSTNKVAHVKTTNKDQKNNTTAALDSSNSSTKNQTNTNTVQNTQKQNVNVSTKNSSNTQAASTSNKSTANNSSQEDNYTSEEAAIAAINYELGSNNKITTVSNGPSGDGYSNFSNGDIAATVFNSITKNGKKYYSVRLTSQSMKKNGGTGTIDNLFIAKDGSIYRN
ncbi:Zn-dependent protease [Clostridium sp. DMHC 10]|uniref:M56 family metallopeptidase n=1 Tax=Clostridium sp. DMHC 10 TaxID=747377 RepID=UPI00069E5C4E|nr:M56 family metallopeptidase [Clostridium sp. DMHC 10]KOF56879.1 Zn-dependent protease [Clostridium sp. DMHC 10]